MAVSTDYGATEPRTTIGSKAYGSSSSGKRKGSSYALNSIGSGGRQRQNSENNPGMFHKAKVGASRMSTSNNVFRTVKSKDRSTVTQQGGHDSISIGSNDSRRMIIRKEIDIKVERLERGEGAKELGNENDTNGHCGHAV